MLQQCYNNATTVKLYRNLALTFLVFLVGSCSPTKNQEIYPSDNSTELRKLNNNSASNTDSGPQADWNSNETWNEYFMMNLMEEMSKADKCYVLTLSDGIFVGTESICTTPDPNNPELRECRLKTDTNVITGFSKIKAFIQCSKSIVDACGSAKITIDKGHGEYVISGCE